MYSSVDTPAYICEEVLLRKNLELLEHVQKSSGVKILLALKGFAMHSTFDLVSKYLHGATASGLNEALLALKLNKEVHTYSPAFKETEIDQISKISDHIVFNSFRQLKHFKNRVKEVNSNVSIGIRVNPDISTVDVDLYNPCAPFSRLGVTKKNFLFDEINGVDGLHFHALCEQNVDALEVVLKNFEEQFGHILGNLKWVNFGGGHHITREDYDVNGLINLLKNFKNRYKNLEVYLEPGEAVAWQTGVLVSRVLDIVNNGIDIAILDTSAETHMPDVLAMPYRPDVRGSAKPNIKKHTYRFGGNSCLAGDIIGDYSFDEPLKIGDMIIFEDMIHYTMVKNTTFNGISLPSIIIHKEDGTLKIVKEFGFNDYRDRLS